MAAPLSRFYDPRGQYQPVSQYVPTDIDSMYKLYMIKRADQEKAQKIQSDALDLFSGLNALDNISIGEFNFPVKDKQRLNDIKKEYHGELDALGNKWQGRFDSPEAYNDISNLIYRIKSDVGSGELSRLTGNLKGYEKFQEKLQTSGISSDDSERTFDALRVARGYSAGINPNLVFPPLADKSVALDKIHQAVTSLRDSQIELQTPSISDFPGREDLKIVTFQDSKGVTNERINNAISGIIGAPIISRGNGKYGFVLDENMINAMNTSPSGSWIVKRAAMASEGQLYNEQRDLESQLASDPGNENIIRRLNENKNQQDIVLSNNPVQSALFTENIKNVFGDILKGGAAMATRNIDYRTQLLKAEEGEDGAGAGKTVETPVTPSFIPPLGPDTPISFLHSDIIPSAPSDMDGKTLFGDLKTNAADIHYGYSPYSPDGMFSLTAASEAMTRTQTAEVKQTALNISHVDINEDNLLLSGATSEDTKKIYGFFSRLVKQDYDNMMVGSPEDSNLRNITIDEFTRYIKDGYESVKNEPDANKRQRAMRSNVIDKLTYIYRNDVDPNILRKAVNKIGLKYNPFIKYNMLMESFGDDVGRYYENEKDNYNKLVNNSSESIIATVSVPRGIEKFGVNWTAPGIINNIKDILNKNVESDPNRKVLKYDGKNFIEHPVKDPISNPVFKGVTQIPTGKLGTGFSYIDDGGNNYIIYPSKENMDAALKGINEIYTVLHNEAKNAYIKTSTAKNYENVKQYFMLKASTDPANQKLMSAIEASDNLVRKDGEFNIAFLRLNADGRYEVTKALVRKSYDAVSATKLYRVVIPNRTDEPQFTNITDLILESLIGFQP